MKVSLVTSPHVRHPAVLEGDFAINQSVMYSFAPVGLLSLIAASRQIQGVTPVLFDLNRQIIAGAIRLGPSFYEQAAAFILASEPDIVGFMTECDSYHHVLQIGMAIRHQAPDCRLVLGGPHATAVAHPSMERWPFIDAIVMGEGECSFPALLGAYMSGNESPINGVVRRERRGIFDGGPVELINELDQLPVPAYELYHPDDGEELFLEVGRGCPFACTFCSTAPFWKRRHRVKSPQRILKEIRLLQDLFGTTRVHFTHDLITTDRVWLRLLCKELITGNSPVQWTCSARTDTVDEEMLALMARAGCRAIYFGIESGSPRILQEIRKNIPLEQSFSIVRACRESGIIPNVGFIVGFPGEDNESLRETFDAFSESLKLEANPTHLFGYCPFAQSALGANLSKLECPGHFLDLPLGELEVANRRMVASDPELFGSYFRPQNPEFGHLLYGVDEFSCLVNATSLPTLLLSAALGGMLEVYRQWVMWIGSRNAARAVPTFRQYYGSPVDFCDYLLDSFGPFSKSFPHAADLVRTLRMSLLIAAESRLLAPTSMANHRSVPPTLTVTEVTVRTRLASADVRACLQLNYDITSLLGNSLKTDVPPARPTYLVWVKSRDKTGTVELLQVEPFIHFSLMHLRRGPAAAGELLTEWVLSGKYSVDVPSILDTGLTQLMEATTHGLIQIEE